MGGRDAKLVLCIAGETLMACEISQMRVGIRGVVCDGLWECRES